jgi:4-alpha-glucanotransferase
MYHPRIGVQFDFIYQTLSEQDKAAFNNLYDNYYYKRHNHFWQEQAMKKLPQLTQSTRMLVCGEDLGMIPDCVPCRYQNAPRWNRLCRVLHNVREFSDVRLH